MKRQAYSTANAAARSGYQCDAAHETVLTRLPRSESRRCRDIVRRHRPSPRESARRAPPRWSQTSPCCGNNTMPDRRARPGSIAPAPPQARAARRDSLHKRALRRPPGWCSAHPNRPCRPDAGSANPPLRQDAPLQSRPGDEAARDRHHAPMSGLRVAQIEHGMNIHGNFKGEAQFRRGHDRLRRSVSAGLVQRFDRTRVQRADSPRPPDLLIARRSWRSRSEP